VATLMARVAKVIPARDKPALAAAKHAIAIAHADWCVPALWVFVVAYLLLGGLTWFCYLRRRVAVGMVPSLAPAAV
jgi:hypothetical protein